LKKSDLNDDNRGKTRQQLFYLLFDFAQKICVRYTGIANNFEPALYEGFAKFFNYGHYKACHDPVSLKKHLKNVLITQCIEKEMWTSQFVFEEALSPNETSSFEADFEYLSDREFIDILRSLPFLLRAVYNMAVIDRFSYTDISEMLNISEDLVQPYLNCCRYYLRRMATNSNNRKKNSLINKGINYVKDERLWQE